MSLKPITFIGDFIAGKFIKSAKFDGQFKDVSPADMNDQPYHTRHFRLFDRHSRSDAFPLR